MQHSPYKFKRLWKWCFFNSKEFYDDDYPVKTRKMKLKKSKREIGW